jgi:hypothetical protein
VFKWVYSFVLLVAVGYSLLGVAPPALAANVGYQDFSYGTAVTEPTSDKPQSKLWYADDIWWGALWNPTARRYEIYRLDQSTNTWITTGVNIDSRGNTKPDMLWDGTRLYAVTVPNDLGGTDQRALLRRYSYDKTTKTYTRDANFPVQVANGPMETIVLDKDTTGRLWVTFTQGSQVYVNHSLSSGDASWGTPFVLPVSGTTVSPDDISALVPFDTRTSAPKMGVMWSNQADNAMYFSTHTDGDANNVWSPTRTALGEPRYADDHINLKALEADASGRVFAAIKTSRNDGTTPNPDDPLIEMLVLGQDDVWRSHVVSQVRENQTKPMVMVDQVNRNLYVFATGLGDTIYYKRTSLDNISFPSGHGTPFMHSDTSGINNVTSTKQNITTSNGLATAGWLALAADSNRAYWHNSLNLDTTAPAPSVTTQPSDQSITYGEDAAFTAEASGSPTPSVQWQVSADNGQSWTSLAGETSTSLTLTKPSVSQSGNRYRAVFMNAGGSATSDAATLTVNKATAQVTLSNLNHTYDGTIKAASASTTPDGLHVDFAYTQNGSAATPTNAGDFHVVATVIDDNYEGSAEGTLTIAKAQATIDLSNLNHVYDGTAKAVTATTTPDVLNKQLTITYSQRGNPVANPTDAGSYAVLASLNDANYMADDAHGTLVIAKAQATLSLSGLSKTYDGTPQGVTVGTNPAGLSGVHVTYNGLTAVPTNAGSYGVVASLDNPNYQAQDATNTLVIAKKTLTVTANNQSITYGDTLPANTVSYNGFVPGENASNLSGTLQYTYNPQNPQDAGTYDILPSGLTSGNYDIKFVKGTLAITKASQIITFGALENKTFGDADFALKATASSGLSVSYSSTGNCSIGGANNDQVHITGAGSCTITAKQVGNQNYNAAQDVAQGFQIAKAQAQISLNQNDLSQVYDGSAKHAGYSTTPQNLSGVSVKYYADQQHQNEVQGPTNAGTYYVVASLDNPNYQAQDAAGTLVIAKADQAPLQITSPVSGTYGNKLPIVTSGGSSSGALSFQANGTACQIEANNLVITSGTGTCKITATMAGNANYNPVTSAERQVTINRAVLDVRADNKSMTYADPVPPLTYQIGGFVNGETLTNSDVAGQPILTATATSSSQSGAYPISVGLGNLSSSSDYSFRPVDGTLTVAKRQAIAVYTGANYIAIPTAGNATINLSAKVSRLSGNLGDLALARVEFTVKKFSGATQTTAYAMADASGNAATTAQVPTSDDPYTVEVRIDPANGPSPGATYWTSGIDVSSLQVIVGSGSGRTAGGGWIPDAANDINGKSNFGFSVQNSKTGIRGNSLLIYRAREGNDEVQYVVKSNSWQGGGLTFNLNNDPARATFTGRATVQRYVNGVFDSTFTSGGYTFTVDNLDGDLKSPRVTDGYAIVVRNSSNQIVKQFGSRTTPVTIGGGNVLIQPK